MFNQVTRKKDHGNVNTEQKQNLRSSVKQRLTCCLIQENNIGQQKLNASLGGLHKKNCPVMNHAGGECCFDCMITIIS